MTSHVFLVEEDEEGGESTILQEKLPGGHSTE